jgi:hypothetical protein
MLTVNGVSKNSGNNVMIVISRESLHELRLPEYPPSVADEQHPYADPWGLPTEDSSGAPLSEQVSEPEPEEAMAEQPAESVTETGPDEEGITATEVFEATGETVEDDPSDGAAEDVEEDVVDSTPEEDAVDSTPEEDVVDSTPEEDVDEVVEFVAPAGDVPISSSHMEAKNVLDTLGVGFDDLPDEPPDWMDAATTMPPPKVYQELSGLGQDEAAPTDDLNTDEPVEPFEDTEPDLDEPIEPDQDTEPDLDEPIEPDQDTEPDLDEPIEPDQDTEPDLDEPIEPDQDTEPDLDEPIEPDEDTEPDLDEPIEPDEDTEPDLDEAVASALSAIETPDSYLEPFETEPTIEPDLDEAIASALSAIETPDSYLTDLEPIEPDEDTEAVEPDEDTEPDLDEAVASALSAIETPDNDLEPFETEPTIEPDLDEAEASAMMTMGSDSPDDPGGESSLIESPSVAWGSTWSSAAQGWIRQEGGRSTWRPIVTTTSDVGAWEVDTFLGIVSGDATITDAGTLAGARKAALQSLVDEALSRGAHAVVGVRTSVHEVGRSVVFSAMGTAVTLKNPS